VFNFQEGPARARACSPFEVVLDAGLLARFPTTGGAYRCYPSPARFVDTFDAGALGEWAGTHGLGALRRGLALSFHAPPEPSGARGVDPDRYCAWLLRELSALAPAYGCGREVASVHFMGDLCARVGLDGIDRLMTNVQAAFRLVEATRRCLRVPLPAASEGLLAGLKALGFDRVVLLCDADGRAAPRAPFTVAEAAARARAAGFANVCAAVPDPAPTSDLAAFAAILEDLTDAAVDHVAVLDSEQAGRAGPGRGDWRSDALATAIARLCNAGYVYLGSGCLAREDDEYAVARRRGSLQLSPVGHMLRQDLDLLAFGPGAISAVGSLYSQNVGTTAEYGDRIERGLPVAERGWRMTPDDLVRRKVIHSLICHGEVSVESVEISHLVDFERYFARELAELEPLEALGMVERDADWISVPPRGRPFVNCVCAIFDRHGERPAYRAGA
jgi:oxygen-independent coproporphyrinogen III oxidase